MVGANVTIVVWVLVAVGCRVGMFVALGSGDIEARVIGAAIMAVCLGASVGIEEHDTTRLAIRRKCKKLFMDE